MELFRTFIIQTNEYNQLRSFQNINIIFTRRALTNAIVLVLHSASRCLDIIPPQCHQPTPNQPQHPQTRNNRKYECLFFQKV